MQDLIGYDEIIDSSMRSVVYKVLKKVETNGLIGKHYFVISFLTRFPGVVIPKSLLEKYPDEMTIVVQYQYKSLVVEDEGFKISLSFNGKYEKLTVSYKAITSFSDPSINFSVRFTTDYSEDDEQTEKNKESESNRANKNESAIKKDEDVDLSAKVVSLDAFRKNKDNTKKPSNS